MSTPFKNKAFQLTVLFGIAAILGFLLTPGCSRDHVDLKSPETATTRSSPPPTLSKPYRVGNTWYHPLTQIDNYREKGIASWYGTDFHGKKTSSGEIYNMYDMTAAHKILPLGTHVRVRNLNNNRTIDVRINDRGPFVRGRIIDLSYTAAKKLEIISPGTAPVEIIALGISTSSNSETGAHDFKSPDYFSGVFSVQVGAFQDRKNAENLRKDLETLYDNAHISTYSQGGQTYYRVRVGRYTTIHEVMATERYLVENGYKNAFSVAD